MTDARNSEANRPVPAISTARPVLADRGRRGDRRLAAELRSRRRPRLRKRVRIIRDRPGAEREPHHARRAPRRSRRSRTASPTSVMTPKPTKAATPPKAVVISAASGARRTSSSARNRIGSAIRVATRVVCSASSSIAWSSVGVTADVRADFAARCGSRLCGRCPPGRRRSSAPRSARQTRGSSPRSSTDAARRPPRRRPTRRATRVSRRLVSSLTTSGPCRSSCRCGPGEQDRHERAGAELRLGKRPRRASIRCRARRSSSATAGRSRRARWPRRSRRTRPEGERQLGTADGKLGEADHFEASAAAQGRVAWRDAQTLRARPVGHRCESARARNNPPFARGQSRMAWRPRWDDRRIGFPTRDGSHDDGTAHDRTSHRPAERATGARTLAEMALQATATQRLGRRCAIARGGSWTEMSYAELGTAVRRDRPRADRARHRARRPSLDPLQHARGVDARRPRSAVRGRRRGADLSHELARGVPLRSRARGEPAGLLRERRAGRQGRAGARANVPRSSTSSPSTARPTAPSRSSELRKRGADGRCRTALDEIARRRRSRRTWPRSSTRRARPDRPRAASPRTPTAWPPRACTRTSSGSARPTSRSSCSCSCRSPTRSRA